MKRHVPLGIVALLAWLSITAAMAEKPSTSKAELQRDATHIIVGRVQAIVSSTEGFGQNDVTHHVAEIAIDKVEKGVDLKPGGLVYARYWSQT